ncbi:mediator of RNA polymerase II transcription subunit 6 [Spathaspora passalidarum NRRL Y-27907]|uniref:Mediator of RNA polymerase II transcription subunit 6 n=1 Tax=Spathaspora passalidarum (strain NRRL Y-27907 / 11-Y1) TaxID=619300 RepID=G3ARB9_SPAPN|nr:mediator of RNA polymerase II transcription subunit 6 [Spathaspora passalidarum NRRL Y-27907]EGW31727.1 mediator of RNA polymerase II transcription subunit 6 [Spathaspora passalidarum NRRL Y-27907]
MEALDEIQWKSPEFIQERGLHSNNVLEYFALSPFYDRTSNNQVLMMQFQYQQIQIPMNMTFHQYFQSRLTEMTGIEFVIAFTREPDFWIVRKQRRLDPTSTLILQDYYIIGANVYQAPRIYDVLSSRLLSSVLSLRNSIDILNNMTSYHISDGGHSYNNSIHGVTSTGSSSQLPGNAQSKSLTMTVSNTNVMNTMTPITMNTPGLALAGPRTGLPPSTAASSNALATSNSQTEITSGSEDNKLVYLDDIPLYGKGSTVEMLGLKTNFD